MQKSFSRGLVLVICLLILTACGSSPKKTVKVDESTLKLDKAPSLQPVLTEEQKQQFVNAIDELKKENYDGAEQAFLQLLEVHPNLAGAYVNLGLIEQARGNGSAATQQFEKALEHNSKNISALLHLGTLMIADGEFSKAEVYLNKAHKLNTSHSLVNYNLGVLYELYLQDFDKAIKHYEKYVQAGNQDDAETVKRWIKLLERR